VKSRLETKFVQFAAPVALGCSMLLSRLNIQAVDNYITQTRQINVGEAIGPGKSEATFFNPDFKPTHSTHSYGAHFVEISWDPEIALRFERI
jgi:CO/xanthine dehydrogenase Mo-binding subunit